MPFSPTMRSIKRFFTSNSKKRDRFYFDKGAAATCFEMHRTNAEVIRDTYNPPGSGVFLVYPHVEEASKPEKSSETIKQWEKKLAKPPTIENKNRGNSQFVVRGARLPSDDIDGRSDQRCRNIRSFSPSRRHGWVAPTADHPLTRPRTSSSTSTAPTVYWDVVSNSAEHYSNRISPTQFKHSGADTSVGSAHSRFREIQPTQGSTTLKKDEILARRLQEQEWGTVAETTNRGAANDRRVNAPTEMPGSWPLPPRGVVHIQGSDLMTGNELTGARALDDWWAEEQRGLQEEELEDDNDEEYLMSWSDDEKWVVEVATTQLQVDNSLEKRTGNHTATNQKWESQDEWWVDQGESKKKGKASCVSRELPVEQPPNSNTLLPSTNPFRQSMINSKAESSNTVKGSSQVTTNAASPSKITRSCDICTEIFEFPPLSSTIRSTFPTLSTECHWNHSSPSHCITCLNTWFGISLNSSVTLEFHCPLPSCNALLSYHDISKFVRKELFQQYDERLKLKALGELDSWQNCLQPGCGFGQDHIGGPDGDIMTCLKCRRRTCVSCQSVMHDGLTCAQYQNGTTLEDLRREEREIRKREAKEAEERARKQKTRLKVEAEKAKKEQEEREKKNRIEERKRAKKAVEERAKAIKDSEAWIAKETKACPGEKCGKRIQKNGGCDHMTCSGCKHQFCWLCLAPYEPIRKQGNKMHKVDCAHYA